MKEKASEQRTLCLSCCTFAYVFADIQTGLSSAFESSSTKVFLSRKGFHLETLLMSSAECFSCESSSPAGCGLREERQGSGWEKDVGVLRRNGAGFGLPVAPGSSPRPACRAASSSRCPSRCPSVGRLPKYGLADFPTKIAAAWQNAARRNVTLVQASLCSKRQEFCELPQQLGVRFVVVCSLHTWWSHRTLPGYWLIICCVF